ncbi:MAG TPA: type II toxin-antitoxin system VapC family toxin [Phycisphaerae bacterium]|nr:type II toxin-antitoxin system VapC family toxin [Phycisphaerae bacterium]
MNTAFVLDCSITMSWCFPDEATTASASVLDRLENESALVPPHWFLEVANVLAMAEKRKRHTAEKSADFLTRLQALDIEFDGESPQRAFTHLLPLCRTHGLTSYDAAYLELAQRRRLPLATLDDDLRSAAKKLGIAILGK